MCVSVCVCERMRSMCALMCLHAPKSLPKAQLPSSWRMVPFHLIYLSRKWTIHFFFSSSRGLLLWRHPSFTFLSLFHFSLSHNFFQPRCLTLPSSLKLCWGHNLELRHSSRNAINPGIPISVLSEIIRPLSGCGVKSPVLMKTYLCLLFLCPPPVCCWCEPEVSAWKRPEWEAAVSPMQLFRLLLTSAEKHSPL